MIKKRMHILGLAAGVADTVVGAVSTAAEISNTIYTCFDLPAGTPAQAGLPHGDAPGSRFDVLGTMVQLEEMTERNPSLLGIECGKSTFGERTEKSYFRVGESIALATASPNVFSTQCQWHYSTWRGLMMKRWAIFPHRNPEVDSRTGRPKSSVSGIFTHI